MSYSQRAQRPNTDNKHLPNLPDTRIVRRQTPLERANSEENAHNLRIQLKEEQDKNYELSQAYAETHSELQRAIKALGSIHLSDKFFLDDKQIIKKVEALRYDIKQWSHQNFPTGSPVKKNITSLLYQPENVFRDVVQDPKYYLHPDQGGDLPVLIQSYIWSQLIDTVFENGMWISGPIGCIRRSELKKPCRLFDYWNGLDKILLHGESQDPESYHLWRSQTARLVPPRAHAECIEEGMRLWVKDRWKQLRFLGPAENKRIFYGPKSGESVIPDTTLQSILMSAVQLDEILWQQRACFRFPARYGQHRPKKFDPRSMESELEDEVTAVPGEPDSSTLYDSFAVHLVKAPDFEKRGPGEENGYGKWEVLLKASVEVVQPTLPPTTELPLNVVFKRTTSMKGGGRDRVESASTSHDRVTVRPQ